MRPLADVLATAHRPEAALHWLRRSKSWALIRRFLEVGSSPSHEDLDRSISGRDRAGALRAGHDVAYARCLLVSAGLLEPRFELAQRFERWSEAALDGVEPASTRWLLRRFARERLMVTIDLQCTRGKATTSTVRWAQARLRAAASFTAWMASRGGLEETTQSDVDRWLIESTTRYNIRDYVRWLVSQDVVDLRRRAVPVRESRSATEVLGFEQRRQAVDLLRSHDAVAGADAFAALLVLLFGQHLSRICRLTWSSHVRLEPARVRLGRDWLDLPEEMADMLSVMRMNRESNEYLFPGIRPGDHRSEDAMAKRLKRPGEPALQAA